MKLNIRSYRKANRMSQADLATALGVTKNYIHRLEKGDRTPSAALLVKLSVLFGVPIDNLLLTDGVVNNA